MEQQLRVWLRYTVVLGLYVSPRKRPPAKKSPQLSAEAAAPVHGKRLAWAGRSKLGFRYRLEIVYLNALLPWICVLYVNALIWHELVGDVMLSWLLTILFFSSQAFSSLLIAAEGIWRRQQHEEFLRRLQEIELSLKLRLKQDVNVGWLVRRVRCLLEYLLWLTFICYCLFIYNFAYLQYVGYFWYSIWFIITMRLRLIQLLIYVRVLQHYMKCLCMKLQQVVAYRMAPNRQLMDINYEKLQSLDYLLAIKEIYTLLFKEFQLLNDFAGWSLFSIVLSYMLDCGCTLYWTLLSWEAYEERRKYRIAGFWWFVPMTVIVWHLCLLCDNCMKLDRFIAELLSKIIITRPSKSLHSYRLLVHQFSAQLQLQYIEVTGKSFFTLNLRLIMSIGIAISTYMVIAIQFLTI
ncbi:putative gustatory receptor 39b [Anastrepha ludens]|uniref:putative gustatory receptor 39b n=1 Tax=Anastrepha ludens TaxID=28586 RepID=UPI0023AEEBE8|nr:putative gustatory receptor 39b [Anastrepha ludens]